MRSNASAQGDAGEMIEGLCKLLEEQDMGKGMTTLLRKLSKRKKLIQLSDKILKNPENFQNRH